MHALHPHSKIVRHQILVKIPFSVKNQASLNIAKIMGQVGKYSIKKAEFAEQQWSTLAFHFYGELGSLWWSAFFLPKDYSLKLRDVVEGAAAEGIEATEEEEATVEEAVEEETLVWQPSSSLCLASSRLFSSAPV